MRHRTRYGEKVAVISALAMLGVLFADWFAMPGGTGERGSGSAQAPLSGGGIRGWDALGWLALALCVIAVVAGIALPLVFALCESPVLPLSAAIAAMLLGGLAVVALLVQVIAQPGPDELVEVRSGWWLGLLAATGIARGGFLSLRDEYMPRAPLPDVAVRPAPPVAPPPSIEPG